MAHQVAPAVILAACFAVLIMVCAAVGEGQRAVPLSKQGMRPLHKEMKVMKGLKGIRGTKPTLKDTNGKRPIPTKEMPPMPPISENLKVTTNGMRPIPTKEMPPMPPIAENLKVTTNGMRAIPKELVAKGMPPMADMPPMPGMPPMPDGTYMAPPPPNSSSFTHPSSLVIGFLAAFVAFFLA